MKKINRFLPLLLALMSCSNMDKMQKAEVDLTNQLGMAVYWYQNSGEKDALYKQSLIVLKNTLMKLKLPKGRKKLLLLI